MHYGCYKVASINIHLARPFLPLDWLSSFAQDSSIWDSGGITLRELGFSNAFHAWLGALLGINGGSARGRESTARQARTHWTTKGQKIIISCFGLCKIHRMIMTKPLTMISFIETKVILTDQWLRSGWQVGNGNHLIIDSLLMMITWNAGGSSSL